MNRKLSSLVVLFTLLLGGAPFSVAGDKDEDKKLTRSEKRLASIEKRYQPTGKMKSCISLRSLRNSQIIDDQTIFFSGIGRRVYFNRLPRRCSRLAVEERFSYRSSVGQLCKSDFITVLDSMGSSLNSCGLGQFEEWEKKPKEKPAQK